MPAEYDATEFVDADFQPHHATGAGAVTATLAAPRAPTREELDLQSTQTEKRLADLKRQLAEVERERAAVEETRRRRAEFQNGRREMTDHLTRGIGLLEQAETTARRDAEQMARTLTAFREALDKVRAIREGDWTEDNFQIEMTRALTTIENARLEWAGATRKFPVLTGALPGAEAGGTTGAQKSRPLLAEGSFAELCRLGFALTWPLALVALLALGTLVALLLRK